MIQRSASGALLCLSLIGAGALDAGPARAGGAPPDSSYQGDQDRADRQLPPTDRTRIGGYLQVWWTVHEEAENGLRQPLTRDRATQETSGFSLHRARVVADFRRISISGRLMLKLEGTPPALLDAYASVPLWGRRMHFWLGQMKIPATYEVAMPSEGLDFLERTRFSRAVADFSLSRSPAISSPRLYGIKTYLRDLGVALKGRVHWTDYFLMVGNGLGANRFIGRGENPEEVETNRLGAYLYGLQISTGNVPERPFARQDTPPIAGRVGAHLLWNRHEDIVIEGGRAILDLDRRSWSVDLHAEALRRLRLTCMYGRGSVKDDFDNDGRTDYEIRGLEVKAQAEIVPSRLRIGIRYDLFAEEWYESGAPDEMRAYGLGATLFLREAMRVRLNYTWNRLESVGDPDPDDDSLVMETQIVF